MRPLPFVGVFLAERSETPIHMSIFFITGRFHNSLSENLAENIWCYISYCVVVVKPLKFSLALIRSHRSYFSYFPVCWNAANKTLLQSSKIIQNRVISYMYKVSRYTRLNYLYLNLSLPKFDDSVNLTKHKLPKRKRCCHINLCSSNHDKNVRISVKCLGAIFRNRIDNQIQTASQF